MNKSILITGGSRGIGAAAVRAFTGKGCTVSFFYKTSHEQARALARETGARAFCVDVTKSAEVEAAFERLGGVDVLVNNAGVASYGLFTDLTEEELDELLAVNVKGAVFCAQQAARRMIRRKEGVIINISSIWGITGASCEAAYSMSKAAIIGLTKALAKELAPSGIRVNCIAPGVIKTDMLAGFTVDELEDIRSRTPLGRLGTPEDAAAALIFLASDEASFITGQVISVDGGI